MPSNNILSGACLIKENHCIFFSGRGGGRGGTPASAARKGNIQEYKGTKISFDD